MTLPELLIAATQGEKVAGSVHGVCVLCSAETDAGVRIKDVVSDSFTGWSYLQGGNCFCPTCAYLFSDQMFRRKSWVASLAGFETFKNDAALEKIIEPPQPPFFIYIAKVGQKQSWLSCLHRVAQSRDRYFLSHEKYDVPIFVERGEAVRFAEDVKLALEWGITKGELFSLEFNTRTWKKAIQEGWDDFLRGLVQRKKNLSWEVIVDVSRGGTKGGGPSGDPLQHGELEENADVEKSA